MRVHITHDRKGDPVVDVDGHEGDSVKDIVDAYKEATKLLKKEK